LGDPWIGRRGCAHGFELRLLCLCLVDSPPVGRGRYAWSRLARCSSCSSLVLACLSFDPFSQSSSVAGSLADDTPGFHGQSARTVLVADGPRCLHGRSFNDGIVLEVCESFSGGPPVPHGPSAVGSRTVRPELAESLPGTTQGC
jgi:hypothetical protein